MAAAEYVAPEERRRLVNLLLARLKEAPRGELLGAQMEAMATVTGEDGLVQIYDVFEVLVRTWLEAKVELQTGERPRLVETPNPAASSVVGYAGPNPEQMAEATRKFEAEKQAWLDLKTREVKALEDLAAAVLSMAAR